MRSSQRLRVSETFCSLQGEGASLGQPSCFLRLALCNLRCTWCDTKYTWDFERFSYEREVSECEVAAVADRILAFGVKRLVVTGGEPLLQQVGLAALFGLLPADFHIEVETNGTVAPDALLLDRVAQWNVSPKLENSGDPARIRLKPEVLAVFKGMGSAWLKLVIHEPADLEQVEQLLASTGWPRERVFLMPQSQNREECQARSGWLSAQCIEHGLRFSPRLHLTLWGGERGR